MTVKLHNIRLQMQLIYKLKIYGQSYQIIVKVDKGFPS
jgi:hypothetical protein